MKMIESPITFLRIIISNTTWEILSSMRISTPLWSPRMMPSKFWKEDEMINNLIPYKIMTRANIRREGRRFLTFHELHLPLEATQPSSSKELKMGIISRPKICRTKSFPKICKPALFKANKSKTSEASAEVKLTIKSTWVSKLKNFMICSQISLSGLTFSPRSRRVLACYLIFLSSNKTKFTSWSTHLKVKIQNKLI